MCLALSGVLEWLTLRSVLCSNIRAGDISRILLLFQHFLHYAANLSRIGDLLAIWTNICLVKRVVVNLLKHVKLSLDLIINGRRILLELLPLFFHFLEKFRGVEAFYCFLLLGFLKDLDSFLLGYLSRLVVT